ncbi:iron complex transport system substrate-binding protein [Sanguibacter gelidistatuariae]|uniref:Iron complex transport system substrate-binding protein n=1 Tax=Sanguibacter gelidistatuariae TaxID=1814289 RepID=A0A1G6NFH6_9MICO|nr:putative F420-0 ABC transporter substrate-binding protein [Sanguibacter gelidistatuariae]SDC66582.1 iron complex transport system substrate-binding protein [Sanguibacter gelidistatuariae]
MLYTRTLHTRTLPALAAGLALALTGCASSTTASPTPSATASATGEATAAGPTAYPLTLDNCGFSVTFDAAPEAVLTIKSSTTEMLLALGLTDSIAATAFPDGPVADWLTDAAATNPAIATPLSEKAPGPEAVTEVEPDLVYAGWESNLTAESAGDRATLATLGVATYVSPSACKEAAYQPNPLTFDDVFAEITEVGTIFDASDAAAALVADQRAELADITPDARGLTALWYSSGSDIPYVGAGIGAPQMIMDAAGLTNIAASVQDSWGPFSWEEVISADPDVIVLVDSAWGSTEKKIAQLESNPATANLTAVLNKSYVVVPFPATEAGIRNVSAAGDVVAQLDALPLAPGAAG